MLIGDNAGGKAIIDGTVGENEALGLTEEESRWETWNKRGFKQELALTGFMVLSIKNYLDGSLRREWLETSN